MFHERYRWRARHLPVIIVLAAVAAGQAAKEDESPDDIVRVVNERLDRLVKSLDAARPLEDPGQFFSAKVEAPKAPAPAPEPEAAPMPVDDIPARLARLRLRGIAYREGQKVAIINDQIAQRGTSIGGFQVMSIAVDSAILRDEKGLQHVIRMDEDLDQYEMAR